MVDRPNWSLEVDEAATVNVQIDPGFRGDLVSQVVKNKLQVAGWEGGGGFRGDLVSQVVKNKQQVAGWEGGGAARGSRTSCCYGG